MANTAPPRFSNQPSRKPGACSEFFFKIENLIKTITASEVKAIKRNQHLKPPAKCIENNPLDCLYFRPIRVLFKNEMLEMWSSPTSEF
jgi:hypothetical protein